MTQWEEMVHQVAWPWAIQGFKGCSLSASYTSHKRAPYSPGLLFIASCQEGFLRFPFNDLYGDLGCSLHGLAGVVQLLPELRHVLQQSRAAFWGF